MKKWTLMVGLLVLSLGLLAQVVSTTVAQAGVIIPNLLSILAPLIVAMVSPLLVRLFKKMGIEIEESMIDPILMQIIELIAQVEKDKQHLTGNEKKELVTEMVRGTLSKGDQQLLIRKYGSLETAVQAAFERSSVAVKK
jgi:uncharacterized membrane protein